MQGPGARAGSYTTRKIITVSDGFYRCGAVIALTVVCSKVDCFWLEGNHTLELYSIIKVLISTIIATTSTTTTTITSITTTTPLQVHNIDFDHQYERGRDLPRIAGMILDFALVGGHATWPPGHLVTWPPGHLETWAT